MGCVVSSAVLFASVAFSVETPCSFLVDVSAFVCRKCEFSVQRFPFTYVLIAVGFHPQASLRGSREPELEPDTENNVESRNCLLLHSPELT